MYSTPPALQASTSVGLIGREALEMSVSPAQKRLKPPPVPEMPIVTFVLGFAFWNSSPTASVIGYTVLEPSAATLPSTAAPAMDAVASMQQAASQRVLRMDRSPFRRDDPSRASRPSLAAGGVGPVTLVLRFRDGA
jgi:hypothetical protein